MEKKKKGFFNSWLFPLIIIIVVLIVVNFIFKYREIERLRMDEPISVPYFKVEIKPETEITDDMIGFDEIPYKDYLEKYDGIIVLEVREILGKCVKKDIVDKTYIYKDDVVECFNNE